MVDRRRFSVVDAIATLVAAALAFGPTAALANHTCDPVTEQGWSVVATHEDAGQSDGTPYQAGALGDWYVDRTSTMLPTCSYFNPIGNYSLRSYTLDPETTRERIGICRGTADSGSVAIPPYAGRCPPK